jgi:hypothetical protein
MTANSLAEKKKLASSAHAITKKRQNKPSIRSKVRD